MSYVQYIWKHEGFGVSNKYGRKNMGTDDLDLVSQINMGEKKSALMISCQYTFVPVFYRVNWIHAIVNI